MEEAKKWPGLSLRHEVFDSDEAISGDDKESQEIVEQEKV